MTRIIRTTKPRRTPLLLMALAGVLVGVLIGGGTFSAAAPSTDASVVDYSQCANGKPNDTPANDPTTCNAGWINGILQGSNSQYSEGQQTAQRLVISLPKNGPTTDRTITIKYLWNKGVHHAYDSLAKWNAGPITGVTTAADACAGVPGSCPATNSNFNGGDGDSQFQVPSSTCSAGKEASDRHLVMFGGTITDVSAPVNDSATCSTSADEYETVTITYDVASTPTRVMLLFGGHLAQGPGAWGSGLGSHDINGGPYHIKLIQLDTSSIGNRDNQISAGAILAITPTMSTTPSNTETFSEVLNDSATIVGNNPSGTMTFRLYDTSANCLLGGTTVGNGGLLYEKVITFSANGNNTRTIKTTDTGTVTAGSSNTVNATGDYYWSVFYSGDGSLNNPQSSECQEHSAVTAPSVTNTGA